MSYLDYNKNWTVYREDPRPEYSHIYHNSCPNRPYDWGELCCVNHKTMICDDCETKVPKRVIRFWNKICKEKVSDECYQPV